MNTYQPSFFEGAERLDKLSKLGDPLADLKEYIDFEQFRPVLEGSFDREKKSPAGRPPLDAVFMFKILLLQRLYNISDEQVEYQINAGRASSVSRGCTSAERSRIIQACGAFASKLVRDYEVTPASTHGSQVELTNGKHAGESLFANSAYKSRERDGRLAVLGINNYIHERPARNRGLDAVQKKSNEIKSRIRVRIEHIYGHIKNSMGVIGLEYIGLARIKTAEGLRNLAYNFVRYVQMIRHGEIVHEK